MDRSSVIYLISEKFTPNSMGVFEPTETRRKVYAQHQSVTADEWFDGGRNGLNPDMRFLMFRPEYRGEQIIEFRGQRYAVYRTYETRNDIIELYVERKQGDV